MAAKPHAQILHVLGATPCKAVSQVVLSIRVLFMQECDGSASLESIKL
jgi:hypothetical protein